jgi:hypothetical protein
MAPGLATHLTSMMVLLKVQHLVQLMVEDLHLASMTALLTMKALQMVLHLVPMKAL